MTGPGDGPWGSCLVLEGVFCPPTYCSFSLWNLRGCVSLLNCHAGQGWAGLLWGLEASACCHGRCPQHAQPDQLTSWAAAQAQAPLSTQGAPAWPHSCCLALVNTETFLSRCTVDAFSSQHLKGLKEQPWSHVSLKGKWPP